VVTPKGANSVDNPAPLPFGVLQKVTLEQNGEYYFRLPTPLSAMTIILRIHNTSAPVDYSVRIADGK
jgi:hypothetical protein